MVKTKPKPSRKNIIRRRVLGRQQAIFRPLPPPTLPPVASVTSRTITTYFPIYCNLFKNRPGIRKRLTGLITAPPIHYVEMTHNPDANPLLGQRLLTFDGRETVYSCYGNVTRGNLSGGDFLCYMINVINYIPPSERPGVNHFLAAVKYDRRLYFFNSWGSGRSNRYVSLDKKIADILFTHIQIKYPLYPFIRPNRYGTQLPIIYYTGPALQTSTGPTGLDVPIRLRVRGRTVVAPSGFCGLVSLDFIVLMRLLDHNNIRINQEHQRAFNTYISQLGSIGLVAGGTTTSQPNVPPPLGLPLGGTTTSQPPLGLPLGRIEQGVRAAMGENYERGNVPNQAQLARAARGSFGSTVAGIPNLRNRRKYILFNNRTNPVNFNTKNELIQRLTKMKGQKINLLNYSIGNPNSETITMHKIKNGGQSSTGVKRFIIPFKSVYNNVNNHTL